MALIQPRMAVKCRTPEEVRMYEEVARKEGHLNSYGRQIDFSGKIKRLYVTNYTCNIQFPEDVQHTDDINYADRYPSNITTIVEAKDLFKNLLISRRLKK